MKSRLFHASPLLSILLLLGSGTANAAAGASAEATVSNIQFHITDLTPNDNQAAGMNFTNVSQFMVAEYTEDAIANSRYNNGPVSSFQAADRLLDTDISHAASHISGVPGEAHGEASIATAAAGPLGRAADGRVLSVLQFSLQPHTGLTITGSAFGQAATSQPDAFNATTQAMALLRNSNAWLGQYDQYLIANQWNPSVSFNDNFSMTYNNNSDTVVGLEFRTVADGSVVAIPTQAVPEPSSAAMLGGGLLLLGMMGAMRAGRRTGR